MQEETAQPDKSAVSMRRLQSIAVWIVLTPLLVLWQLTAVAFAVLGCISLVIVKLVLDLERAFPSITLWVVPRTFCRLFDSTLRTWGWRQRNYRTAAQRQRDIEEVRSRLSEAEQTLKQALRDQRAYESQLTEVNTAYSRAEGVRRTIENALRQALEQPPQDTAQLIRELYGLLTARQTLASIDSFTLEAVANDDGRLASPLTRADIAAWLSAYAHVAPDWIVLQNNFADTISELGLYAIGIRIPNEPLLERKLWVVPSVTQPAATPS